MNPINGSALRVIAQMKTIPAKRGQKEEFDLIMYK
jgi:hypothetical protein